MPVLFAWRSQKSMSRQGKRSSARGGPRSLLRGTDAAEPRRPSQERLARAATDFVAKRLHQEANRIWSEHPHEIATAIDKVEQVWALTHDPKIAVQLATMYDKANRNHDGMFVLRDAFRRHPDHALVRHHAAITLLRHGEAGDIRDFCDSVVAVDPDDAFARFTLSLLDRYETWVTQLATAIAAASHGRRPFIVACPVWGQPFADHFVRYLCAGLLSTNNLPRLAERCAAHLAIFTTAETEAYLRADAMFRRLGEHSTIHFMRYESEDVNFGQAMDACYGTTKVFYSKRPLAFYYARNCKFLLMSCAHYVALAAGRRTDAFVSCQVADTILNDGSLSLIAEKLEGSADAVLINSIALDGPVIRAAFDRYSRRPDGVLEITAADCTRIVVEHLPAYNFADEEGRPHIPLRVCWRVGPEAVLVHGNHYHPMGLRPGAFDHPLHLSTDPVDSRFVDRSSLALRRVHLAQDASIVGLSIEDGPLEEQLVVGESALSIEDVAFWLWGYWGRLRGALFRSPLRFGTATPEQWQAAEAKAFAVVDAVVGRASALEEGQHKRRSWRL
jgi:hypothetical protein